MNSLIPGLTPIRVGITLMPNIKITPHSSVDFSRDNVTLPIKNIDHPPDKIFGGIPAGSSLPAGRQGSSPTPQ